MYFCLEGFERHSLAIDANIAILLILWYDAVTRNFAIFHMWHVEEFPCFDSKKRSDGCNAADIAIHRNKVYAAVVGECRWKEVSVGGHEGHVTAIQIAEIVVRQ